MYLIHLFQSIRLMPALAGKTIISLGIEVQFGSFPELVRLLRTLRGA